MQGFLRSLPLRRTYSSWQHSESLLATELSQLSIQGRLTEAVRILQQIPNPNHYQLNSDAYLPLIRSCIKFKAFDKGKEIHRHIIENGVEPNLVLQNNIMMMYSKSGDSGLTRKLFDEMTERNLFSWTAIIGAYSNSGDSATTFEFYEKMILAGAKADNFIYPVVLKSCGGMRDLRRGRRVHAHVITSGFQWDLVIMNSLIDMYAKCESLGDAERAFCECDVRDVFTWTTMLVGYVQLGYGKRALNLFNEMMCSEVKPRSVTFLGILPAFSDTGCLSAAKQIHGLALINGLDNDTYFSSALIDMYGNCGGFGYGQLVFDRVKGRDIVCWNTLIKGYLQVRLYDKAIELFQKMLTDGISPNGTTFDYIIPLYLQSGNGVLNLIQQLEEMNLAPDVISATLLDHMYEHIDDIKQVEELHGYWSRCGYKLGNAMAVVLIQLYSKFADIEAAEVIFNSINSKDLGCYNTMIACYAYNGYTNKALELLDYMLKSEVEPNLLSWNTVIAGFVDVGDLDSALQILSDMLWRNQNPDPTTFDIILPLIQSNSSTSVGKELHCMFLRNEGELDRFFCTTFISMYGKCGDIASAVNLFETFESKDLVSWNAIISALAKNGFLNEALRTFCETRKAGVVGNIVTWTTLIAGYTHKGLVDESLKYFRELHLEGLRPNSVTIASILQACARAATLSHGKSVHAYIIRSGLDDEDLYVSNALIDMFVKCGCMEYAERAFRTMPRRDVVSWNTMIHGFAINGNIKAALALFDQMEAEGAVPNNITFIEVLNACSHAGLVSEGWKQFNSMESKYGILRSGKHYACMVDILGRGGHFEDVRNFIVQMPLQPTASLWGALLSACKIHGNVEMAEYAANHLIELQPENPGNYVVLSNIYATAGRWNDVDQVRKLMISREIKKSPGGSWIEIGNKIHAFTVENFSKQEKEEINRTLLDLVSVMLEEGYVPDVNTMNLEDMAEG